MTWLCSYIVITVLLHGGDLLNCTVLPVVITWAHSHVITRFSTNMKCICDTITWFKATEKSSISVSTAYFNQVINLYFLYSASKFYRNNRKSVTKQFGEIVKDDKKKIPL